MQHSLNLSRVHWLLNRLRLIVTVSRGRIGLPTAVMTQIALHFGAR